MKTVYYFSLPSTRETLLSYSFLDMIFESNILAYLEIDGFVINFLLFQWADAVLGAIGKPWSVPWTAETILQVSFSSSTLL